MSQQPNRAGHSGARQVKGKKPGADKRRKEIRLMVVMIVIAVIMVIAAVLVSLYARWVRKPVLPPSPGQSGSVAESQNPGAASPDPAVSDDIPDEPDYDPVQPKVGGERKSEDFYTILVFGSDEASGLTDTIMVVSYDVTNQKATAMSIPRDTLVNAKFSGIDPKKVNAVYKFNGCGQRGIKALKNEVSELVGFTPDYYVMINWELVGQMVEAIGGVWFDVPWDMWYRDPYQDLYIDLKEGYQLLNGDQAMQLVRWRKNMDPVTYKILNDHSVGDVGRLDIQHDFLKAVLKQTLQLKNATKISQLAKLFGENVTSDLTVENLFWFASQAIFGGLNVDDVNFVTMPFAYGFYPVNGKERSFVYPSQRSLLTLINDSLNPFVQNVTIKQLDLMSVASDGSLRSSTGVLADPSVGVAPVKESESPQPGESDDPGGSDAPPEESGDPEGTPSPLPTPPPGFIDSSGTQPSADPEPTPSDSTGLVPSIPDSTGSSGQSGWE